MKLFKWFLSLFKGGQDGLPTYELVDRGSYELSAFKITSGVYAGVTYLVGEVGFSTEQDGNPPILNFRTQIIENPTGYDLNNDQNFTNITGAILIEFMKSQKDDISNWLYNKG